MRHHRLMVRTAALSDRSDGGSGSARAERDSDASGNRVGRSVRAKSRGAGRACTFSASVDG